MGRTKKLQLEGMSCELSFLSTILKSGECRYVSPVNLREELAKVNPNFRGSDQQDAHEALITMLETIEKELKAQDSKEELIDRTFNGKTATVNECTKCKHNWKTEDMYRYLHIPIPDKGSTTLETCIKSCMDPEIVTDKECKKCNNSMEAKLYKTLTRMPNILIVQLRRFSWDGRWQKKIHH